MIQIEEQLGRIGIFQNTLTGFPQKDISAPGLNKGAKAARNIVSAENETLAQGAGIPDFGSTSREFSNLARRFPDKKGGVMSGLIHALKTGVLTGAFGGGKAGTLGAMTDLIFENPKARKGIYDLIASSGGKSLGRAGISYGASSASKNR